MSRTIITTCGTSLFQSSSWKYGGLNEKQPSQMDETDRRKYEIKCRDFLKQAMEDDDDISTGFDRFSWDEINYLRDLPAELASVRAIQIHFSKLKPLGKGDKIVLLHSSNEEGKYCYEMLRNVLNNEGLNLLPGVEIDTDNKWEIEGLDPINGKRFEGALHNIWEMFIELLNNEDDIEYIFNLTGGYKSVTTLLGGIAYHLSKTQIFYLHEDTNYEDISTMFFDKKGDDMKKWLKTSTYNIKKNANKADLDDPEPINK